MRRCGEVHDSGQMTVELAAMLPVIIVVALIVYNLAKYAEVCSTFDRISLDAAVSHGASPSGTQSRGAAVSEIEGVIRKALNSSTCDVTVSASDAASAVERDGLSFPLSPLLTTYRCTLTFHPWPTTISVAGVGYAAPISLRHERTITVDRFRPGVVI